MKKGLLVLLSLILAIGMNAQIVNEYDFNDLDIGDLDGQDDWATILHTTGPHDFFVDLFAGSVVSPDGTQAIFYNGSGAGFGRTATRKASSNFNFDLTQADIVEIEVDMHRNYWGMFFGVGFDADGDGHIAPGLATELDDGGVQFHIATQNANNNKVVLPDGSSIIFTAENEGWCRYKMVLDFTANDGQGAIALSYDPGVTGEWIAIPEIQGLNLGLTQGSGNKMDRTVWDGVFLNGTGGTASYDNILISQTESQGESQYIEFPAIANKLATDPSFELEASATSGLTIEYEITEGPATIDGSIVTLTGDTGVVIIIANQAGDDIWGPAPEVAQSFLIVDATLYSPDLIIRRPADNTEVYMNNLSPILIVASAYIDHPDVLNVDAVYGEIDGQTFSLIEKSWNTGYFSIEWTPPDFGTYTMEVTAASTGGMYSIGSVTFEVTNDISDMTVQAFELVQISTSTSTTVTQDFVFPTFVGSFDEIMCYLDVTCPAGGCDPWDRVGNMEAKGPNGEWVEIFRYITPYGVPCDHSLDATDYASIFQGLVEMRFTIGTDDQGFVVDVSFDFQEGTPQYKYSWVDVIWNGTFPFGDYENLQPMEIINWNYDDAAEASKLKVINTGHGWGDLNTGNASEFYEATHKIIVNEDEYDQHLWVDCNPNPDGCQPQNGTWYFDRAGWCPGSISYVYNYDLTSYVNLSDVEIEYEFYPGYVDLCHPNHPDCETGVTCGDCESGFNPHYIISGNLVSYSNSLYIPVGEIETKYFGLHVFPNPSIGLVHLTSYRNNLAIDANVTILNHLGQVSDRFTWNGDDTTMDLSTYSKGVYFIEVDNGIQKQVERIILK